MQPLRITAHLSAPMVTPTRPLHLDGLLADLTAEQPGTAGDLDGVLAVAEQDGQWVYKASAFQLVAAVRYTHVKVRSPSESKVARDVTRGVIRTSGDNIESRFGWTRAYRIGRGVADAKTATAWAIGDFDKVCEILSSCEALGAERRNGMGRIARWEVMEDPAAQERWQWRALPWRVDGAARIICTVRPPYYLRHAASPAWMPWEALSGNQSSPI